MGSKKPTPPPIVDANQRIVHRVQISKEAWVGLFDAACDLACTLEIDAKGTPDIIRKRLDLLLDACESVMRETGKPTEADGAKKRT